MGATKEDSLSSANNDFNFELAITELFSPYINLEEYMTTNRAATTAPPSLPEALFPKVARLLELSGKKPWSLRPRTYTILRIINRLDAMNDFVSEGLYDISIPYSLRTLPDCLKNPSARAKFFEVQPLVLCAQACAVESGEGRHRHFAEDGDVHFAVIRELGSGGFGDVHHVLSRLSRNEFARKRLARGKTFERDRAAILNFERELETLKRLSHQHLVKYVGSYTDKKFVGILMSPVADCDLLVWLKTYGTSGGTGVGVVGDRRIDLRKWFGCLVEAVGYLHENRIRHKDIKPSNVLVHGANVLITDFGTARDWTDLEGSTTDSRLNGVTRRYAAPEVLNWQPRNSAADIYSLGCVFLEMATVLRGQTIDQLHSFYSSNGTHESSVLGNGAATNLWIAHLQTLPNPAHDNDVFNWIPNMILEDQKARPTIFRVRELINASEGVFMGNCCKVEEDDSDSSYEGSDIEEGIASEETATRLLKDKGFHRDIWNTDSLRWAAGEGETAVVRLLLRKGANPEIQDKDGFTPLHAAASKNHLPTIRLLFTEHPHLPLSPLTTSSYTPLHFATLHGHLSSIKYLVRHGASLSLTTSTGYTPLHFAVRGNYVDIVRFLIMKGADVEARDRYGYTAMHLACMGGLEEMVGLLVEKGADVQVKDGNGRSGAMLALEEGRYGVIRILQGLQG